MAFADGMLTGVFDDTELLRMWSVNTPAAIFPKRRLGHFENGYEASLLALEGDPSRDWEATRRIRAAGQATGHRPGGTARRLTRYGGQIVPFRGSTDFSSALAHRGLTGPVPFVDTPFRVLRQIGRCAEQLAESVNERAYRVRRGRRTRPCRSIARSVRMGPPPQISTEVM